jgi:hypothetical protein
VPNLSVTIRNCVIAVGGVCGLPPPLLLRPVVMVAKHLCGVATDLALRGERGEEDEGTAGGRRVLGCMRSLRNHPVWRGQEAEGWCQSTRPWSSVDGCWRREPAWPATW